MTAEERVAARWKTRVQNAIQQGCREYVRMRFPTVYRRIEAQAIRLVEAEKRIQHQAHASE